MNKMKEKIKKTREYLDYIEEHYDNVQKAWSASRPKLEGLIDQKSLLCLDKQIAEHDLSKMSIEEFIQYRERFSPINENEQHGAYWNFQDAWDNHKKSNQHHWQNWIYMENKTNRKMCIIHNVIDWIAMAYKFGDSAEFYYGNNKTAIRISDGDREYLEEILDIIGG